MNSSINSSERARPAAGLCRLLLKAGLLMLLVFATYGTALCVVDPCHKVHSRVFGLQEQRMLSPMLIRRYAPAADGLLTGSSMVENFAVSQFKQELGVSLIKVPLEGGTAYELKSLVAYALRHGRLREVVFGFDLLSARGEPRRVHESDTFRNYLYRDGVVSMARYFTDPRLVSEVQVFLPSYAAAVARHRPLDAKAFDFDEYSNWGDYFTFSASNAVASFVERRTAGAGFGAVRLEDLQASFEANVMTWIDAHPEVHFIVLYPPYSHLFWTECIENGTFDTLMEFKRLASRRLLSRGNVEVHDFQVCFEVTHDLDRYKDLTHYSPEVSRLMVRAIRAGTYRVTAGNCAEKVDALVADSRRMAEAFWQY